MKVAKRPNDVWLRIWLIITWIVLNAIDSLFITPLFTGIWYFIEMAAFTIISTTILTFMWITLKHPDCECWDDIKVVKKKPIADNFDCMGEVEES